MNFSYIQTLLTCLCFVFILFLLILDSFIIFLNFRLVGQEKGIRFFHLFCLGSSFFLFGGYHAHRFLGYINCNLLLTILVPRNSYSYS